MNHICCLPTLLGIMINLLWACHFCPFISHFKSNLGGLCHIYISFLHPNLGPPIPLTVLQPLNLTMITLLVPPQYQSNMYITYLAHVIMECRQRIHSTFALPTTLMHLTMHGPLTLQNQSGISFHNNIMPNLESFPHAICIPLQSPRAHVIFTLAPHYYKTWVQFISPCSLD
jgi:hypothetical protein